MNKGLNHLFSKIAELKKIQLQQMNDVCFPKVESILASKSKDTNEIEHTLDALLEVAWDAKALYYFRRLCRYYYDINPVATADYVEIYREWWDSE